MSVLWSMAHSEWQPKSSQGPVHGPLPALQCHLLSFSPLPASLQSPGLLFLLHVCPRLLPGCSVPNYPTAHSRSRTSCVVCWAQCNTKISFVKISLRILKRHQQNIKASVAPCSTVQAAHPWSRRPSLSFTLLFRSQLVLQTLSLCPFCKTQLLLHAFPLWWSLSDQLIAFPQWNMKSRVAVPLRM